MDEVLSFEEDKLSVCVCMLAQKLGIITVVTSAVAFFVLEALMFNADPSHVSIPPPKSECYTGKKSRVVFQTFL